MSISSFISEKERSFAPFFAYITTIPDTFLAEYWPQITYIWRLRWFLPTASEATFFETTAENLAFSSEFVWVREKKEEIRVFFLDPWEGKSRLLTLLDRGSIQYGYTVRRARPLFIRRLRVFLPPGVLERFKKPWLRLRFLFFG